MMKKTHQTNKEQERKCFKIGKKIFKKLSEINESIEIIAREIARQAKGRR